MIYPGGAKEVLNGNNYNLSWKEKCGFANVALESKVVCIFLLLHFICF
jgi:hypothetical protein